MKLSDVDNLVSLKRAYVQAAQNVNQARSSTLHVLAGQGYLPGFLSDAVRPVVLKALEEHRDQIKSKLMLLGVDEFEGQ